MASIYKIASGWRAQIRLKDKPTISKIFPSKREAVIWSREQEAALHKSSGDEEDEQYLVMVKERLTELRRRIGVAKAFMDRQKVTVH